MPSSAFIVASNTIFCQFSGRCSICLASDKVTVGWLSPSFPAWGGLGSRSTGRFLLWWSRRLRRGWAGAPASSRARTRCLLSTSRRRFQLGEAGSTVGTQLPIIAVVFLLMSRDTKLAMKIMWVGSGSMWLIPITFVATTSFATRQDNCRRGGDSGGKVLSPRISLVRQRRSTWRSP
jgi:hypothetical protein